MPTFYKQALKATPAAQRRASDEMLRKTGDLINDVKKKEHWEALFTDAQINGWLAVDVQQKHPKSLPREVRDPRVIIEPDRLILAFRLIRGKWSTVVSLVLEPSVPEPNVLALRIRKARGGTLPLPLERILDEISKVAERLEFPLQWRQADGDPVALISLPPPHDDDHKLIQINTLRLGQGELFLSGTTTKR